MIALCIVKYTSHSLLRPTEPGNSRDFDFLAAGPWYDPVLTAHLPSWVVVTNGWCAYFFAFMHESFVITHQPRGLSRTVNLFLQFPIVTTRLWGQLAGNTMTVIPAVCYYTALSCLSRSIKPIDFLRIVEAM